MIPWSLLQTYQVLQMHLVLFFPTEWYLQFHQNFQVIQRMYLALFLQSEWSYQVLQRFWFLQTKVLLHPHI